MDGLRELAQQPGGEQPLLLFYALLQRHPELPFGPLDGEQVLLFAHMMESQAGSIQLPDSVEQLFSQLVQHPDIIQLYWWQGQFAPPSDGEQAAAANPFWRCPGGTQALLYGHEVIRPLHQFLEGISEARYQSNFAPLRKQIFKQAQRREPLFLAWSELSMSEEATEVLRELVMSCLHWNAEPTPVHLGLSALSHVEPFLQTFLSEETVNQLRSDLEEEVLGRLPRSRWQLDGLSLTRGGELLLGPESRYHEAERLLGRGRVGRWLEGEFGRLRVTFDQSVLESIEWRPD